jgi:hypothetical protein
MDDLKRVEEKEILALSEKLMQFPGTSPNKVYHTTYGELGRYKRVIRQLLQDNKDLTEREAKLTTRLNNLVAAIDYEFPYGHFALADEIEAARDTLKSPGINTNGDV